MENENESINPIDKKLVAVNPGSLPYAHHAGSAVILPEDLGKVRGLAIKAMYQQTDVQLNQIKEQIQLLINQSKDIHSRIRISEQIYMAAVGFDPVINHIYHLYSKKADASWVLSMVAPQEWGRKNPFNFLATVRLMADHTWEILKANTEQ